MDTVVQTVLGPEEIESLEVSIRVVEGRAVGKLPLREHTVVVKMSHSSHLVDRHMEPVEEHMAKRSNFDVS